MTLTIGIFLANAIIVDFITYTNRHGPPLDLATKIILYYKHS